MRTYLVVLLACALSATAWSAEEATHDAAKVIEIDRSKDGASLQTLTATPDGKIVALVSRGRYTVVSGNAGKPASQVLLLNDEGAELKRWEVEFTAQSIGVAPDGVIYVAGDGQVASFDKQGRPLELQKMPHLEEIINNKEKLRERAEETLKAQRASRENALKSYETQLKRLRDQPEEDLTDLEKRQIKSLESIMASYERAFANQDSSIESVMASLTARLRTVNSVAVTEQDVFIACGELTGYGYALWRMDRKLGNAKQVMSGLRGCCGQMDVQASGDKLYVAENTKHQVGVYDRDGKPLEHFGKRDRISKGECFGGCCNPMNCRVGSNGDIYTAESEGVVKRFSADGQFAALIGSVKLTGGCKNVAVAASPSGDKVYFCDLPGSKIHVLTQKPDAAGAESN